MTSALVLFLACRVFAGLPEPGNRGTVRCELFPGTSYEIYLPSTYGKGKALPILYTFSPGGGGMVGEYKNVCERMQVILVGNRGFKNDVPYCDVAADVYAMMLDVRQRVEFTPAMQFTTGMSGGAWQSFTVARWYKEQIHGVLSVAGWLGEEHTPWFRHGRDLLVARLTGTDDRGARSCLDRDAEFLKKSSATIRDWPYPGGHVLAPEAVFTQALSWLLDEAARRNVNEDESLAMKARTRWRDLSNSQPALVLAECLQTIHDVPRSWRAYEAQRVLDALFRQPERLGALHGAAIPSDPATQDYLGFLAYGAALAGDVSGCRSAIACRECSGGWDADWSRVLGTVLLFAPKVEAADVERGREIVRSAYLKDANAPGIRMLAAAYSVKAGEFEKAVELLKDAQFLTLKYPGPNGKDIQKFQQLAGKELEASLGARKNLLVGKTWLRMLPD